MPNQAEIQEKFLQALINDTEFVSVFMLNGIRLTGHIASSDEQVVILESLIGVQMVFKHAIATVMPGAADRRLQLPYAAGNRSAS